MRPALLLLLACETEGVLVAPEASLERMIEQPRADAYEPSRLFADGRVMQHPPRGTIPYRRDPIDPAVELGRTGDRYVSEIPIEIDRDLLHLGRRRFTIVCATCHGELGDGRSAVAEQMGLVKPPSLLSDRIRAYPPGRIFRVATEGFGLMPPYHNVLSPRDRWAVIAYLQALQLRDRVSLDELPPRLAAEAEEALR